METVYEKIEQSANDYAALLAGTVYKVYDNNFIKLSQVEDVLCFMFDTLDSVQFYSVLKILHDALDCPLQAEIEEQVCCEEILDHFSMSYMFSFDEEVLDIGLRDTIIDQEEVSL